MKKAISMFVAFLLILTLVSCNFKNDKKENETDKFTQLITYCSENADKQSVGNKEYYIFSWKGEDSSQTGEVDFTANVYESKVITVTGKSVFLYNAGIENEVSYTISFVYGSDTDVVINYRVEFSMKMTRLKDSYNYYPYTMDEVRMSDPTAVFNVSNQTVSCNCKSYSSKSEFINFDDNDETLRSVSLDAFKQLDEYVKNKANISLFNK